MEITTLKKILQMEESVLQLYIKRQMNLLGYTVTVGYDTTPVPVKKTTPIVNSTKDGFIQKTFFSTKAKKKNKKNKTTVLPPVVKTIPDEIMYLYCTRDSGIPALLIAHTDTVHAKMPDPLYHDREQAVMWSPCGLGADDRAGVFACIELAKRTGVDVLFTAGEESGAIGATAFCCDITQEQMDKYHVLVQLDRRGVNDAVFYDNASIPFHEYVTDLGFVEEFGTFSDISVIAPNYQINSVNLSIGYDHEHTKMEILYLSNMLATMRKVESMLNTTIPKFEYEEEVYLSRYSGKYYEYGNVNKPLGFTGTTSTGASKFDDIEYCDMCCAGVPWEEIVLLDGQYLCPKCKPANVSVCAECGDIMDAEHGRLDLPDICDECYEYYFNSKTLPIAKGVI